MCCSYAVSPAGVSIPGPKYRSKHCMKKARTYARHCYRLVSNWSLLVGTRGYRRRKLGINFARNCVLVK